jgi:hypothetical protein
MPLDFTDKYNTTLSQKQEGEFQNWLKKSGRMQDLQDYDMRGAWAAGEAKEGGHMPDTFKKPNHPTFSNESKYHGADGYEGGEWAKDSSGKWTYTASPTNVGMHGKEGLHGYFGQVEKDVTLKFQDGF